MTTHLLLARVGAGKTAEVQRRLLDLKRRAPLARVWVLLSTERQIVDFRQRFVQNGRVFANIETFTFYDLYHRLLAVSGTPQRCLDDTARFGLIRALLGELYGDGEGIFGGIAQMPGFVQTIATFIFELKQNLVEPAEFLAQAATPKERELAQIYAEYQQMLLDHDLVDREGEGWVALAQLARSPSLGVDLLIVDGYDQFNRLQAALLAALGRRVRETLIALTTVPGREATIGRRFQDALDRLLAAHEAAHAPLTIEPFTVTLDERDTALRHLAEQILRPQPERIAPGAGVQFLEAPDPAREVGALLRRVKRLLLDGCAPDDILLALRDWPLYSGQVAAQGRVYDLPLALHYGEPLAQNPALAALLDLIDLHAGDFRRRELLDALRSPYFAVPGLDARVVDLLDRLSVDQRVHGGREAWLSALDAAARAPETDDEEEEAYGFRLPAWHAERLQGVLSAFFDAVTPPRRGSVEAYAAWLEHLIGRDIADPDDEYDPTDDGYTLAVPAQIRADADGLIVARDLAAMQHLIGALRELLAAQRLAGTLGYGGEVDWKSFARDLRTTIEGTVVGRGRPRDGRVLVTTVADARGLPHRHVFVLGLSEGIFPQPTAEDPLLLDSERERLRAAGIELTTQAERAGEDGLFYSLIGQARDSLTLSRPHSKNGEAWAPSHLWRAALAVFDHVTVEHLRLGDVPTDPATPAEAALAAADALSKHERPPGGVDPAYWGRIRQARQIELDRLSRRPHDHYSGRLRDPALIAQVAESLTDHVWSASQLNDYGLCGFRYFAGRLLRLEALEEPEEGMDSRQLGTLYHEILEETYRRLGGLIAPERIEEALQVLDTVAGQKMRSAPERLGFRRSAQWEQEQMVLRRRLERLIRDDFGGNNPLEKMIGGQREVYRQETRFEFTLPLDDEALRVRGAIDRIDRQGERVIVVDYKTGSARIAAEEVSAGRNFQMMIYLLAAQAMIDADESPDRPNEVRGGVFWRIGGEGLGTLTSDQTAIIGEGKAHLSRYLALMRAGDFAAHASKLDKGRCAQYCDFHQFCRVSMMHPRKE